MFPKVQVSLKNNFAPWFATVSAQTSSSSCYSARSAFCRNMTMPCYRQVAGMTCSPFLRWPAKPCKPPAIVWALRNWWHQASLRPVRVLHFEFDGHGRVCGPHKADNVGVIQGQDLDKGCYCLRGKHDDNLTPSTRTSTISSEFAEIRAIWLSQRKFVCPISWQLFIVPRVFLSHASWLKVMLYVAGKAGAPGKSGFSQTTCKQNCSNILHILGIKSNQNMFQPTWLNRDGITSTTHTYIYIYITYLLAIW